MPLKFRLALAALPMALVAFGCASLPYSVAFSRDNILAVDIALESDVAIVGQASPSKSHITLVRSFIRGNDLHETCAVLGTLMSQTNLANVKLAAAVQHTDTAGTAIVLYPNQQIRRLEERVVEALRPIRLNPATAESFIVTADGSMMTEQTIATIDGFVPHASGINYRPQLLVSPAQADAAKQLGNQVAENVTLRPIGLSVYHIGGSGKAERLLWTWTGEPGARRP